MNTIWNLLGSICTVAVHLLILILCALSHRLCYWHLLNVVLVVVFSMYGRFLLKSKHWRFQFFPSKDSFDNGFIVTPSLMFLKPSHNTYLNGRGKFCEHAVSAVIAWGVWGVVISIGYASFDPAQSEFMKRNRADHISSDRPRI